MMSGSNLERVLRAGKFAVTGELGPPRGADVDAVNEKAKYLRGMVDAINVTDNQTAVARMASMAVSALLVQQGLEPNFQMVCRDRNRIAMQADILGAAALGIKNMLCLSGDHQVFGDDPKCRKVFDLDSIQLVALVKKMRDEGKFLSGKEITRPPRMFIGAAANPFAEPYEFRVIRLAKKIQAGADFVQTQCIYNMDRLRQWLKQAVDMGLAEKVFILAGVTPMKSVGMARYMQKSVPGLDVPDWVIQRLQGVDKKQQASEGIAICCEQIAELREMKGIAGVHLMAIEWEQRVPEIVERAGLLPRPVMEDLPPPDRR
jgi:methylenetetrahydrofolate reductase (NADPH)